MEIFTFHFRHRTASLFAMTLLMGILPVHLWVLPSFCSRRFSPSVCKLEAQNGSVLAPFSASNCDIRCHNWLHISHSLGFSLLPKGFCHRYCHLSVVLGDSTSPLEFWSSNSFALSPDGFLGPLRSSNFASDCGSILYIGSGATSCVGSDDYICRSPLPNTCIHSMSSIYAPLPLHCPLHLMNCILLCNSLAFTSLVHTFAIVAADCLIFPLALLLPLRLR